MGMKPVRPEVLLFAMMQANVTNGESLQVKAIQVRRPAKDELW